MKDNSSSLLFDLGNSCPYISDDLNEDTISVLVRLITEKKGMRHTSTSRRVTYMSMSGQAHFISCGFRGEHETTVPSQYVTQI